MVKKRTVGRTGRPKGAKSTVLSTKTYTYRAPIRERGIWYTRRFTHSTGKIERIRLDARTRTEARQAVLALFNEQRALEDNYVPGAEPKDMTIREALARYCTLTSSGHMRPMHVLNLKLLFGKEPSEVPEGEEYKPGLFARSLEALGVELVGDVTLDHIEALFLREWAHLKGRTLINYVERLRKFWRWAVNHGYATVNPFDRFDVPTTWREQMNAGKYKGIALTHEQCQRFLRACKDPYKRDVRREDYKPGAWRVEFQPPSRLYSLVLLGLRTGLRFGNLVGLTWRQLNLADGIVEIAADSMKAKRPFRAPLHAEVVAHLRGLLAARTDKLGHAPRPDEVVLEIAAEGRVSIRKSFDSALKRAGLDKEVPGFRPHDMRHTHASLLAERAPYAVLQLLLGHATNSVTDRYAMKVGIETMREYLDALPWFVPAPAGGREAGGKEG